MASALMTRIREIIGSNVNDLLEKYEDPVKMVKYHISQLDTDIADTEKQLYKQLTVSEQLTQIVKKTQAEFDRLDNQIRSFVASGKDEEAKEVLKKKITVTENLTAYEQQSKSAISLVSTLKDKLAEMKSFRTDLVNKKDLIVARAEMAKTTISVNEKVRKFDPQAIGSSVQRMESKVVEMEAKASASEQLAQLSKTNYNLSTVSDAELEEQLKAYKSQIAQ